MTFTVFLVVNGESLGSDETRDRGTVRKAGCGGAQDRPAVNSPPQNRSSVLVLWCYFELGEKQKLQQGDGSVGSWRSVVKSRSLGAWTALDCTNGTEAWRWMVRQVRVRNWSQQGKCEEGGSLDVEAAVDSGIRDSHLPAMDG